MGAAAPSTDTGLFEYHAHLIATKVEPRPNFSEREAMLHIEMDDLLVALDEILVVHVTRRALLSLPQRSWQPHPTRRREGWQENELRPPHRHRGPHTMALANSSEDQFGDTRPEGLMQHHSLVSLDTCRCCATMPVCIENIAI